MKHILDNFVQGENLTPGTPVFQMPYHIFSELLAHVRVQLSSAEQMEAFYFHSLVEKAMSFLKKRELHSARINLDALAAIDRSAFPACLKEGVETILLACEAYYCYVVYRYDEAVKKLEQAMPCILTQKSVMPVFITNLYEQNINLLRIYIRTNDVDKTVEKATDLLASILYNINTGAYMHEDLAAFSETEKDTWLHYVVNSLLLAVSGAYKNRHTEQKEIVLQVINNLLQLHGQAPALNGHIINALRVTAAFLEGDDAHYAQLFNTHFSSIRHTPVLLKQMLLGACQHWLEKNDPDAETHPNFPYFKRALADNNIAYTRSEAAGKAA